MNGEIIVTATKAFSFRTSMAAPVTTVTEEGLGDLKLYRVPMPTTVASNAQKQVAMHDLHGVKLKTFHTATLEDSLDTQATIKLRTRNRKEDGLGVALPGGPVAVFEPHGDETLLVGQGGMRDYAVNEDVELTLASSPNVHVAVELIKSEPKTLDYEATVTNANRWPITFEGTVSMDEADKLERPSARLTRKFGRPIWTVKVPANSDAKLRYRVVRPN